MKKIWTFLTHHLQKDFNAGHYCFIFLFLAICLLLNYRNNFQNDYLASLTGLRKFTGFFLLYSVAYFVSVISYSFFYKEANFFLSRTFWVKSILVLVVLGLDNSIPFLGTLVDACSVRETWMLTHKVFNNMLSLFTVLVPLLCYYFVTEGKERHLYGLQPKRLELKPYLMMLGLMIPLIALASFDDSFIRQYPLYKTSEAHNYFCIPEWITVLVFEASYAFDFISVEFLFRGFLVIGMMSILGRNAVFTMSVVYCFLHFGKPPAEAISSIFGGYILGVIAYESKSIWGGILIHVGIAWSMELAAYLQHLR